MITTNYVPNVKVQLNGKMVYFVGTPQDLKPFQDWLFNLGATDATELTSLGGALGLCYFTAQHSKVVAKLAFRWQSDFMSTVQNFASKVSASSKRAYRATIAAKALRFARARAMAWLAALPSVRDRIVTKEFYIECQALGHLTSYSATETSAFARCAHNRD